MANGDSTPALNVTHFGYRSDPESARGEANTSRTWQQSSKTSKGS